MFDGREGSGATGAAAGVVAEDVAGVAVGTGVYTGNTV